MAEYNEKKEIMSLTNEIKTFCSKKNLFGDIKDYNQYIGFPNKLQTIKNEILSKRKNKKSKLKANIEKFQNSLKEIKDSHPDNFQDFVKNLINVKKNIEVWSKIKGGTLSVWNSKISNALKKLSSIYITQFVKESILKEHDFILKKIDKESPSRLKISSDEAKKGLEEYVEVSYKLKQKLVNMNTILERRLNEKKLKLGKCSLNKDILKNISSKEEIITKLNSNQQWQKNLLKIEDLKNTKLRKEIEKLSSIDITHFEKELTDKINKMKSDKAKKEEEEKKYKENINKEIKKHEGIIKKVIEKLKEINIDLDKFEHENKINNFEYERSYEALVSDERYKEKINKIQVEKRTDKEKEFMCKYEFIKSISTSIERFSNLLQNKTDDAKFIFSENSISNIGERFKSVYTLEGNKLILENYDNDKLSTKLIVN